jgi:xylulokinase
MDDLVLGIDASTTALKAIAFDRSGRAVAESRVAYPTATPLPGWFEQDAEDWWRALAGAVRAIVSEVGAARIRALAIGHQRETFVLLDAAGRALRPAILWLDERARAEVEILSARLGRERIRDISGKPPDPTPALYALAWLRSHEPDVLASAGLLLDVHGALAHQLTGRRATALPSADPLGLVDLAAGDWSDLLVEAAGLSRRQLPELLPAGSEIGTVTPSACVATGLSPETLVIAGGGDGQVSGLGVGALSADRAYLSLGTGVVTGMASPEYRTSDAFRTLSSPVGGFMAETVLRSGMTLVDWLVRTVGGERPAPEAMARLAEAAAAIPPGSGGLLVVPYWAGVMNPWWDGSARGTITGLSLDHTPAHLFRATVEGIAFEQKVATDALEAALGRRASLFVACGGGTRSDLAMQVMASVLGRPLAVSPVPEAVALGAGILAATGAGWYADAAAAAAAMVAPPDRVVIPDPALAAAYAPIAGIYADLHLATRDVNRRLRALASPGASA